MKKKVLITGSNGFIGYHLILKCLEKGLVVVAAVRSGSRYEHLEDLPVHILTLRYEDVHDLRQRLEEVSPDYIIHAAGSTKAPDYETYYETNVTYTSHLLAAAQELGVKKLVFISSLAALGSLPYDSTQRIHETTPPAPLTSYGRSKLAAEHCITTEKNIPWVIIRPTAVYGPREKDLLVMIKGIRRGWEAYIGTRPQKLSFIYVKDLAAAVVESCLRENAINRSYNISDNRCYDRYAFGNAVKRALNRKTFRLHVPLPLVRGIAWLLEKLSPKVPVLNREKVRELVAENWDCDSSLAARELGFQPEYDLEAGLEETIKWYKEHGWI